MTYRVEQFVRKIKSPVTVKIGDKSILFPDGERLAEASFDEPLLIGSLTAEDNRIIIQLVKNDKLNDVNWIGEEQASFF